MSGIFGFNSESSGNVVNIQNSNDALIITSGDNSSRQVNITSLKMNSLKPIASSIDVGTSDTAVNLNGTVSLNTLGSSMTMNGRLTINNSQCIQTNLSRNPVIMNYSDVNTSVYQTHSSLSATTFLGMDGVGLFNQNPNYGIMSNENGICLGVHNGAHTIFNEQARITSGGLYTDSIDSINTTLNIGGVNCVNANLCCGNTVQVVNIGKNASADYLTTINIGGPSDTVNISGSLNYIYSQDLVVKDKLIQINAGSAGQGTARGAGLLIRDSSSDSAAYLQVGNAGTSYLLKAPESTNVIEFSNANISTGFLKANSGVVTSVSIVESDVTNLVTDLGNKASINTNTFTGAQTIDASVTNAVTITNSTQRPIKFVPIANAQDMMMQFNSYNANYCLIGMAGSSSQYGNQGDMSIVLNGGNASLPTGMCIKQSNGSALSPALNTVLKIDSSGNIIYNNNVDIMAGGTGVGPTNISSGLGMGCNNGNYGWIQQWGSNKPLLINSVVGSGCVGIGPGIVTNPSYTLTVQGTGYFSGQLINNGQLNYGSSTIYNAGNTLQYFQINPSVGSMYSGANNLIFDGQGQGYDCKIQGYNNVYLSAPNIYATSSNYPILPATNIGPGNYQYQFLDFSSASLASGGGTYSINNAAISYSSSSLKYAYIEIYTPCSVNTWYNIKYSITSFGTVQINEYCHMIPATTTSNRWIYAKLPYLFVRLTLTDNTSGSTGVASLQITTT